MKGAYLLLEKNGVLIRTQYTAADRVRWTEGDDVRVAELMSAGFGQVKDNLVNKALQYTERLRDAHCAGREVTNGDLIEIIKMLREY